MGWLLRDTVKVVDLRGSRIPKIRILELEGSKYSITMDMHEELAGFSKGDILELVISTEKPEYREGVDLCARGVVVGFKGEERRILISLWGYLAILRPKERVNPESLGIKPTDQVYYCLLSTQQL